AIILMVMGHVIGDTAATGLRVEDHSLYRHVYFLLEYLRMPLFTVISGFVYSMLPVALATAPKFLGRKIERLFFPLLTIGTLQYVLHAIIPGTNVAPPLRDIWMLYVYSHDQFWFLHAIFLVFVTIVALDGFHLMDRLPKWGCCLLATTLLSLWGPRSEVFSFTGYLNLLPYFVLGCGIYRFPKHIFRRELVLGLCGFLAVGFYLQECMFEGQLFFVDERINPVALLVGMTGTVVLFALRKPVRWLAWLGGYSYGIFLLHVFPVAGSRIVLMKLGLHNREVLFVIGLLCGLSVPILLEIAIRKNPHLQRFLLGERPKVASTRPNSITSNAGAGVRTADSC
ncbi:MAG: acyltransferase, partial [Planctomycetaceae bacterium]|nr:acyltransferase [Planctomycetaceae bacterium]